MNYYVYILTCSDNTYYVGHTDDLEQRIKTHNAGQGAIYTAKRRPVSLIYHEIYPTKKLAVNRECQIKKWSRAKKHALINGNMQKLHQLAKRRAVLQLNCKWRIYE